MAAVPTRAPRAPASEDIADRYLIERELGQGGMGEVLAVRERSSGKRFALKRLLKDAKPRHAMLLSREFHTLHGLAHANVVQAFDYGLSRGLPYYTMELLEGSDVEGMAPLHWSKVVPILRDVTSALSLLHARHLLHRDVSARNVWRTTEGVVKLMDFGALASFGEANDIAGTPPYLAPEALRSRVLDQRTDLYALGALTYFLLSGRHAYPARSLAELEQHWSEPPVPLAERIARLERDDLEPPPERFEQLIDALLALEPDSRPSSAAEVLEWLDEIAPSERESVSVSENVQGVLLSKAFVGRAAQLQRIEVLLKRLKSGAASSAALIGPRGIGRSRVLAQVALEARLAGITVVSLVADGDKISLSLAARALLKVFELLPTHAHEAALPHARVLGHLSDELCTRLELDKDQLEQFPETIGEARLRITSALNGFWAALSKEHPVAILIDDFEAMDEASAGFFATLTRASSELSVLVLGAVRSEQDAVVPESARAFVEKSLSIALEPLLFDEGVAMLRSMFGDAEHLERTAQYLVEKSEGNPGRLMELCEWLVHGGTVRWLNGAWLLPQEIAGIAVPASRRSMIEANLSRLNDEARELAGRLSVFEGLLSLEMCGELSPLSPEALFNAISELSVVGSLVSSEGGYRFRDDTVRAAFNEKLSPESRSDAHRRAGRALLKSANTSVLTRLTAGLHLLTAGEGRSAAAVVNQSALDIISELPEERRELAQKLEQALALMRPLELGDRELLAPLCVLAWCGYFTDRRYAYSYGSEALACAQRACGMDDARRYTRRFGRRVGLYLALARAAIGFRREARKSPLVPSFRLAMRLLVQAAGSVSGTYTICVAREKLLSTIAAIEPLTALGPNHAASIVHEFGMCCAETLTDTLGGARTRWERLIARLDDPRPIRGMDSDLRAYYLAGSMYAFGATEAWRDNSRALEIADRLEQQPLKLFQASADQIRLVYHGHQGNMRKARHARARVEARALQRGMTWQVEIWTPGSTILTAVRQHDALSAKRASGQLQKLAADTPDLRVSAIAGQGTYLLVRGRHDEAAHILEDALSQRDPLQIGRANLEAQLAQAYNALGRFAEAKALCEQTLARLAPEDLVYGVLSMHTQIERALADAGLGQHDTAAAQLDQLIATHGKDQGPVTLGALHEARVAVALRAKDEARALEHLEHMERWYRSTDCPSLIQHCDRIAKRWRKARRGGRDAPFVPSMSFLANISTKLTMSSVIHESPNELLAQLVKGAISAEGVLTYGARDMAHTLVKTRAGELPSGLMDWIETRMAAAFTYSTNTEDADDELVDLNAIQFEGKTWRLFLLLSDDIGAETVIGAIALCNPLTQIPLDLLRVLAKHLHTVRDGLLSTGVSILQPNG